MIAHGSASITHSLVVMRIAKWHVRQGRSLQICVWILLFLIGKLVWSLVPSRKGEPSCGLLNSWLSSMLTDQLEASQVQRIRGILQINKVGVYIFQAFESKRFELAEVGHSGSFKDISGFL